MIAVDDVKLSSNSESFNTLQWGAYPGTSNNSLYSIETDGSKKELTSPEGTHLYDIPNLHNTTNGGLYLSDGTTQTSNITAESFRDSSDLGLENDGFKPISANNAMGDGFAYNESNELRNARILDEALVKLSADGYQKGDMVNSGYSKTLRIVENRNKIINHCYNGNKINDMDIPLYTISASEGIDELDVLSQRITDIRNWATETGQGQLGDAQYGKKWSQLYYPAASACYAYEPKTTKNGEALANKFKKHNWFLPTVGIIGRLAWYMYKKEGEFAEPREDSLFSEAIKKGKLIIINKESNWSSTESTRNTTWRLYPRAMTIYSDAKYSNMNVRPVCAF
jgi:hypothetical protein